MDRVVELEIWSPPNAASQPLDGKQVAAQCRTETGLTEHQVLGLSFVPDAVDTANLLASFASQELDLEQFNHYCTSQGLLPDVSDEVSAASFLATATGQPLAWLHLPSQLEGFDMAAKILKWAESRKFELRLGSSAPSLTLADLACIWSR